MLLLSAIEGSTCSLLFTCVYHLVFLVLLHKESEKYNTSIAQSWYSKLNIFEVKGNLYMGRIHVFTFSGLVMFEM